MRPLFPTMPGLVHVLSSTLSLADYERSRPAGPRQASDDVIAATVLWCRRYFAFCVFVHVIAPWRAPLPCERALWHERRPHADLAVAKPRRPSWSGGICSARESARESRAAQTAELVAGSGMGWRGMLWVCGGRRSADGRQSPGPPALRIHPLMMHLHRLMGRARTHARALSDARQNRDRYMCRTPAQFGARKRSWAV